MQRLGLQWRLTGPIIPSAIVDCCLSVQAPEAEVTCFVLGV